MVLDLGLVFDWSPHERDICGRSALHHVEGVVDRLLLGDEPHVDLEGAHVLLVLLVHAVHLVEVLLELVGGGGQELLRLSDLVVGLGCAFSEALGVRDLEALSHEGVTDSLDLVFALAHGLEDD